jgi:hypothetical protein
MDVHIYRKHIISNQDVDHFALLYCASQAIELSAMIYCDAYASAKILDQ